MASRTQQYSNIIELLGFSRTKPESMQEMSSCTKAILLFQYKDLNYRKVPHFTSVLVTILLAFRQDKTAPLPPGMRLVLLLVPWFTATQLLHTVPRAMRVLPKEHRRHSKITSLRLAVGRH